MYGRLGDHELAYKAATRALDMLGKAPVRSRALILAEVARALFRVGEIEQGEQYGREAKALAERLEDTLALCRLEGLRRLLRSSVKDSGELLLGRVAEANEG